MCRQGRQSAEDEQHDGGGGSASLARASSSPSSAATPSTSGRPRLRPHLHLPEVRRPTKAQLLKFWNRHRSKIRLFCFGQSISLGLALVSSASSTIEAEFGVVIPLTMSGIVYSVLALHLLGERNGRASCGVGRATSDETQKEDGGGNVECNYGDCGDANCDDTSASTPIRPGMLRVPWWNYFIVAFLDVQANFIFMQAFRYTSLTSAQLLSSLAVPSAMLFSFLILHRDFRMRQFVGATTCIVGGLVMVLSDSSRRNGTGSGSDDRYNQLHPHSLLGDAFAVLGAVLYGLTDTIAEHFVKNVSRREYLGMLGLFGAIISCVQATVFERSALHALFNGANTTATYLGEILSVVAWYVICLVYVYVGFSYFLEVADVTLLILSLQTSQLWASLFSIVVQQVAPYPSFYIATAFMVGGVFIYEYEDSLCTVVSEANGFEVLPILTRRDPAKYGSTGTGTEVVEVEIEANRQCLAHYQ
mmetsp:Transcript_8419/g.18997  ORF Transcript_8419/g.18997 Transcript_8419/m.18997 type:complete len:475 (-) Transcript_8419:3194-4618(-)